MPDLKPRRVPTYRLHKNSGRALTTIAGRDYFLGRYGTPASFQKYEQLKRQWLSNGMVTPVAAPTDLTVVELLARFWVHAERHYTPTPGSRSTELDNYRYALRPLRRLYGDMRAGDFGPLELMLVRDEMIAAGWCRNNVNRQIGRLKHVFKWATKFRLVPGKVREELAAVEALRPNRSLAPETDRVAPVPEDRIVAVLEHLSPPLRAMVQLQALTGARSGELCIMRTCDLDMSGAVWIYRPSTHKMAHRGQTREIRLGPRAQALLRPWLKSDMQAFLFTPAEADAWRREQRRRLPQTPSQLARSAAALRQPPRRAAKERYTTTGYRRAMPGPASSPLTCRLITAGAPVIPPNNASEKQRCDGGGIGSTCGTRTNSGTPPRPAGGASTRRTLRSCSLEIAPRE